MPLNYQPFRFWCQKVLPLVYDDSLSYYELLCKVVDYINNILKDLNGLSIKQDELEEKFNQLQQYVENYFKNLDVQDEINKKLDEMVASGALPDAILQALKNVIRTYETVAEMKADTALTVGYKVRTTGFYSSNDGGGAYYTIQSGSGNATGDKIALNNGLCAFLVHSQYIDAGQLGFAENIDNTPVFNSISTNKNIVIKFGGHVYPFSPLLINRNNHTICMEGFAGEALSTTSESIYYSFHPKTIFVPFNSNQDYIIKIGGDEKFTVPANILTYYFTGYYFKNISLSDNEKPVNISMMYIEYCSGMEMDWLFNNSSSRCLVIHDAWEIFVGIMRLRTIVNFNQECVTIDKSKTNGGNVTCIMIDLLDCEQVYNTFIKVIPGSNFQNSIIKNITFEDSYKATVTENLLTKEQFDSVTNWIPIFDIQRANGIMFGRISLQHFGLYANTINGVKSCHSLFRINNISTFTIDTVCSESSSPFFKLVDGDTSAFKGIVTIGNIDFAPISTYLIASATSGTPLIANCYIQFPYRCHNYNCNINPRDIQVVSEGDEVDIYLLSRKLYGIDMLNTYQNETVFSRPGASTEDRKIITNYFVPMGDKVVLSGAIQGSGGTISLKYVSGSTTAQIDKLISSYEKPVTYDLTNIDYDYCYLYATTGLPVNLKYIKCN